MPGEYPRRLGASPLRAKALFIMPKYVTTRNILMNVVTEFDRNNYAVKMYKKAGFLVVDENSEEYIMTINL